MTEPQRARKRAPAHRACRCVRHPTCPQIWASRTRPTNGNATSASRAHAANESHVSLALSRRTRPSPGRPAAARGAQPSAPAAAPPPPRRAEPPLTDPSASRLRTCACVTVSSMQLRAVYAQCCTCIIHVPTSISMHASAIAVCDQSSVPCGLDFFLLTVLTAIA